MRQLGLPLNRSFSQKQRCLSSEQKCDVGTGTLPMFSLPMPRFLAVFWGRSPTFSHGKITGYFYLRSEGCTNWKLGLGMLNMSLGKKGWAFRFVFFFFSFFKLLFCYSCASVLPLLPPAPPLPPLPQSVPTLWSMCMGHLWTELLDGHSSHCFLTALSLPWTGGQERTSYWCAEETAIKKLLAQLDFCHLCTIGETIDFNLVFR